MGDASFIPDPEAWEPWRPDEVKTAFASARVPWAIAGGWAIDLYLEAETRPHGDIEVAIARHDTEVVVACLDQLEWFGVGNGRAWPLAKAPDELHQTWGRCRGRHRWRIDVFREPWDGEEWVFRRDARIRRPVAEAIASSGRGIPYVVPDIVPLFKANGPVPKDEKDFEAVVPQLTPAQIEWLRNALEIVHPKHEWIELLSGVR